MTRDEILAMQPGREMDVAVAERVMGWTNITTTDGRGGVYVGWPPDRRSWQTEQGAYVPRYSHADEVALRIVPAMGERGYDCGAYYEADARRWTVYFLPPRCGSAKAQSTSLAEAISKAALLAVLEEADAT